MAVAGLRTDWTPVKADVVSRCTDLIDRRVRGVTFRERFGDDRPLRHESTP
jgi:hypothetical protein